MKSNKEYRYNDNLVDNNELWFAWYPIRTGAWGIGSFVWLKYCLRLKTSFDVIYQKLD